MIINNYRSMTSVKLRRFILSVIFMLLVILPLMTNLFDFFENSEYFIPIVAGFLFILFYLYEYFLNYYYIYYNDEGPKIIIRFYSMRIFQGLKKAVEIPKNSLVKFEIETSFLKKKKLLFLYQQHKNEVIKYPYISITLLKKTDVNLLNKSLSRFVEKS